MDYPGKHYDSSQQAKEVAADMTNSSKSTAKSSLKGQFSALLSLCSKKGDVVLRKPSKRKEINGFYHQLGYQLVSNRQKYTTYAAKEESETHYYTSGYSGTISSSGSVSLSPDTSSYDTKYHTVREEKEKSARIYRWIKIVPRGKKESYLQRENNFVMLARPFFQIKSGCRTNGEPSALATFLYTLLITVSFIWTSIFSVFWLELSPSFSLPTNTILACAPPLVLLSLAYLLYIFFVMPYRDKRRKKYTDVRDSRFFIFNFISPVHYILTVFVLRFMNINRTGDWNSLWFLLDEPLSLCLILGGLFTLSGLLLSIISLFYLIFFPPYENLADQHSNRKAIKANQEWIQRLENEYNSLIKIRIADRTDLWLIGNELYPAIDFKFHALPRCKLKKWIDEFTPEFSGTDTSEEDTSYLDISYLSYTSIEYAIKAMSKATPSKKEKTQKVGNTGPNVATLKKPASSVTQDKPKPSNIDKLFAKRLHDVERYTAENGFSANPKELYDRWKNRLASLSEDEKALVWEVLENYYGDIFEFTDLIEEDGGKIWKGILEYIAPRLKNKNIN